MAFFYSPSCSPRRLIWYTLFWFIVYGVYIYNNYAWDYNNIKSDIYTLSWVYRHHRTLDPVQSLYNHTSFSCIPHKPVPFSVSVVSSFLGFPMYVYMLLVGVLATCTFTPCCYNSIIMHLLSVFTDRGTFSLLALISVVLVLVVLYSTNFSYIFESLAASHLYNSTLTPPHLYINYTKAIGLVID